MGRVRGLLFSIQIYMVILGWNLSMGLRAQKYGFLPFQWHFMRDLTFPGVWDCFGILRGGRGRREMPWRRRRRANGRASRYTCSCAQDPVMDMHGHACMVHVWDGRDRTHQGLCIFTAYDGKARYYDFSTMQKTVYKLPLFQTPDYYRGGLISGHSKILCPHFRDLE